MRIYVVPVNGARIPYIDDAGHRALLPDGGASVPETGFWLRRLRDGEVKIGAPPSATPNKSAKAEKE
jgi:hypothetical protein